MASFAADENDSTISNYVQFCDDYYKYNDLYTVYDKNGDDISDLYYEETYDFYQNGKIDSIYAYMKEYISYYKKLEPVGNPYTRGSIQSVKETQTFYATVNNTSINSYEIVYTLTGKFSYNANTGKITSADSPTITLTHVGISGLMSGSMSNVSTSSTISSDGYKVTFKGQFKMTSTLSYASGLIYKTEVTGPYTASFTTNGV